jgi:hypothetical protein
MVDARLLTSGDGAGDLTPLLQACNAKISAPEKIKTTLRKIIRLS